MDEAGNESRVGWPFPSPLRSWLVAVGLGRLVDRSDYAIGSVLLLRAEALEQVGGFDEEFFLYAEETDWAKRAALLGWRHTVATEVTALHTELRRAPTRTGGSSTSPPVWSATCASTTGQRAGRSHDPGGGRHRRAGRGLATATLARGPLPTETAAGRAGPARTGGPMTTAWQIREWAVHVVGVLAAVALMVVAGLMVPRQPIAAAASPLQRSPWD
ncbi:MAG: hypothetical protein IPH03_08930 [Tetrasphaera sp.]|nr:hypothetical protein [Tetrasphaera sp.]